MTKSGGRVPAPVEDLDWRTNSVTLRLEKHTSGSLVFSQPVYPGWLAYVDDQPREISKYEIFTRIDLYPGDQVVRFEYSPWFFPLLGWLSLVMVLITAGLFLADGLSAFKR